ncbi:MAG: zinc ribbon domain-containing protein [Phycisphaerales bacterium]|nr:zinc ribbon domain-containing protein [Phycisphaerales bacterium]
MSAADATVSCPACSKRVKHKPELAGKKLRCSCGQIFLMPAQPGGIAEAVTNAPGKAAKAGSDAQAAADKMAKASLKVNPGDGGAYDLSDDSVSILPKEEKKPTGGTKGKCPKCGNGVKPEAVICINCGYNLKAGTQVASEVPPAKKGGSSVLDAYAATARARGISVEAEESEALRKARITEIYAPIGLAFTGVLAMFATAAIFVPAGTTFQLFSVMIEIGVQLVLRMPFLVLAIFLTAKIMQVSFGPFLTALLKLVGLAFFTAGVGGLIDHAVNHATDGLGSAFITPLIHLAIFWGLSVFLFSLDFMESMVLYLLSSFLPWLVIGFIMIWVVAIF